MRSGRRTSASMGAHARRCQAQRRHRPTTRRRPVDAGPDDPGDAAALARYALALADGIEAALAGWVVGCVERILVAYRGQVDPEERRAAEAAGAEAVAEVGPEVRALLLTDIDEQRTSPLALVRGAVRYPTAVLEQAGVPPVERDPFTVRQFPDDPLRPDPGVVRRPRPGPARTRAHLGRGQGPRPPGPPSTRRADDDRRSHRSEGRIDDRGLRARPDGPVEGLRRGGGTGHLRQPGPRPGRGCRGRRERRWSSSTWPAPASSTRWVSWRPSTPVRPSSPSAATSTASG